MTIEETNPDQSLSETKYRKAAVTQIALARWTDSLLEFIIHFISYATSYKNII